MQQEHHVTILVLMVEYLTTQLAEDVMPQLLMVVLVVTLMLQRVTHQIQPPLIVVAQVLTTPQVLEDVTLLVVTLQL
jgi:hypothetical protein